MAKEKYHFVSGRGNAKTRLSHIVEKGFSNINAERLQAIEYLKHMKELENHHDAEHAHSEADGILCDVLKSLGYGELIEAYEKVTKWYG